MMHRLLIWFCYKQYSASPFTPTMVRVVLNVKGMTIAGTSRRRLSVHVPNAFTGIFSQGVDLNCRTRDGSKQAVVVAVVGALRTCVVPHANPNKTRFSCHTGLPHLTTLQ
jgi:hypothetical protein